MQIIIVETIHGPRIELAVADKDVVMTAHLLETSSNVSSFHVNGMNVRNQQAKFGTGGFVKWQNPITQ